MIWAVPDIKGGTTIRVLFVNHTCGVTSTGKICTDLAKHYESIGYQCKIAYGRMHVADRFSYLAERIGSKRDVNVHALNARIFDCDGMGSRKATKRFLVWAETYNPDILWLHNLHGYYINVEMLFAWIKTRSNMQVKWTLHDCWAFTGHCTHFTVAKCEQWKEHCRHCKQKREYPASFVFDFCYRNFERKHEAFIGVKNMTIITPSCWLAGLVKQSFLREYSVEVIHNVINTDVFKPTKSDFREKHNLVDARIVLGVANAWQEKKGFFDFMDLANMLDDRYAIVLVGLSETQKEKLLRKRPKTKPPKCAGRVVSSSGNAIGGLINVVQKEEEDGVHLLTRFGVAIAPSVHSLYREITGHMFETRESKCRLIMCARTESAQELAALYSTADFFVNPTQEDTYPTTNLEAIACGTWVITYDSCGAKETIEENRNT